MNVINLRNQVSFFGNYDEIIPNAEIIKTLFDLLSDKKLIPNQFQELGVSIVNGEPINSNKNRLRFTSQDKSLNINFNADRIDFIITNINIGVFAMPNISDFIKEVEDIISRIDKQYNKQHKRIGFVKDILIDGIDSKETQKKFNTNIPFFNGIPLREWSNRVTSRVEITEPSKDILNIICDVKKVRSILYINSKNTEFDGVHINVDVNTISENNNYRFNHNNISSFIKKIVEIEEEISNQALNHISN